MFSPNQSCRIRLTSGKSDVRGQPIPGRIIAERCAVVKLLVTNEKSSVRADSSASRGNAQEMEATSIILLSIMTQANIDDIILIAGVELRIKGRHPRFDVTGALDHFEMHAILWKQS